MAINKVTLSIVLEEVQAGQYYLKGTRLAFDSPYAIYVVNGDRYMPYYRVHIGGQLAGMFNYEREAEQYLLQLTSAQALFCSDYVRALCTCARAEIHVTFLPT